MKVKEILDKLRTRAGVLMTLGVIALIGFCILIVLALLAKEYIYAIALSVVALIELFIFFALPLSLIDIVSVIEQTSVKNEEAAKEIKRLLVVPKGYVYFEKYGYGVFYKEDREAYYVNFTGVEGVKKLLKEHPAVKVVTKEEYENSIEQI